jgi:DNA-binding response OmpR family regulator
MPKRAKILVVDDERSIRELLEIFLKKEGFAVTPASSAEEGLVQVRPNHLVVGDVRIVQQGIERCYQIGEAVHLAYGVGVMVRP